MDNLKPAVVLFLLVLYLVVCAGVLAVVTVPAVLVLGAAGLVLGAGGGLGLLVLGLVVPSEHVDLPASEGRAPGVLPDLGTHNLDPGVEPAWRTYLAGEVGNDAKSAVGMVAGAVSWLAAGLHRGVRELGGVATFCWPLLPVPYVFIAAVGAGAAAAVAVAGVVVGVPLAVWLGLRSATVAVFRRVVVRRRRRARSAATCTRPGCDEVTELPVVECRCGEHHHELRPGVYGALKRRCRCGDLLPATADAAARMRQAARKADPTEVRTPQLRCPRCHDPLDEGALCGADVRVAVVGAPGAGATRFAVAALTAMTDDVRAAGGTVDVGTADTEHPDRLRDCTSVRLAVGRREGTVHLYDAPGAVYGNRSQRTRLHHLPNVRGVVLVVDPLLLPRLAGRSRVEPDDRTAVDPQHTYRLVVDAMLDQRAPLRECALAVAVTRTDELKRLFPGRGPSEGSSTVRKWLGTSVGLENLVLAAERDFGDVRYFAVAAPEPSSPTAAAALRWLVGRAGLRLPGPRSRATDAA